VRTKYFSKKIKACFFLFFISLIFIIGILSLLSIETNGLLWKTPYTIIEEAEQTEKIFLAGKHNLSFYPFCD